MGYSIIKEFCQDGSANSILNDCGIDDLKHMTHIDNLGAILKHGLCAHNNEYQRVDISNVTVNAFRSKRDPIFNRSIHSYVPFYFNARNAMMFNVVGAYGEDIVVLGVNGSVLENEDTLITDGNAACNATEFSDDLTSLYRLNWGRIFADRWNENGFNNNALKSQMMAEALIPEHVSPASIDTIYVLNKKMKTFIEQRYRYLNIPVVVEPSLFFK